MNFNRPALAHRIDAFMSLPLDVDIRPIAPEQRSKVRAHLVPPRTDFRPLTDNRDIEVSKPEPPRGDPANGLVQKNDAVLALVLRIGVREELPDVRFPDCSKQGVSHSMQNRIAIRVADRARRVIELDPPKHTWPAPALGLEGFKAMQIVTVPNPEWRHPASVADTTMPHCPDSMAGVAGGAIRARRCLNAASVSG